MAQQRRQAVAIVRSLAGTVPPVQLAAALPLALAAPAVVASAGRGAAPRAPRHLPLQPPRQHGPRLRGAPAGPAHRQQSAVAAVDASPQEERGHLALAGLVMGKGGHGIPSSFAHSLSTGALTLVIHCRSPVCLSVQLSCRRLPRTWMRLPARTCNVGRATHVCVKCEQMTTCRHRPNLLNNSSKPLPRLPPCIASPHSRAAPLAAPAHPRHPR